MRKLKDCSAYAVWFIGLAYVALWPWLGHSDDSAGTWRMPSPMDAVGMLAATAVAVHLAISVWKPRTAPPSPDETLPEVRRERPEYRRPVKPRAHFGLRNVGR